jgi:hypothetical protein
MSDPILTERADGTLRIQINRPEKKNALTVAMYAEIAAALERAAGDPAARGRGDDEADPTGGGAVRQASPFPGGDGGVPSLHREQGRRGRP